jgi:hypothetical protein
MARMRARTAHACGGRLLRCAAPAKLPLPTRCTAPRFGFASAVACLRVHAAATRVSRRRSAGRSCCALHSGALDGGAAVVTRHARINNQTGRWTSRRGCGGEALQRYAAATACSGARAELGAAAAGPEGRAVAAGCSLLRRLLSRCAALRCAALRGAVAHVCTPAARRNGGAWLRCSWRVPLNVLREGNGGPTLSFWVRRCHSAPLSSFLSLFSRAAPHPWHARRLARAARTRPGMAEPTPMDESAFAAAAAAPMPPLALPLGVSFTPLLTQSLNGFAVVDGEGRYVWVSDSMCNLLHADKAALLGCVRARVRAEEKGRNDSWRKTLVCDALGSWRARGAAARARCRASRAARPRGDTPRADAPLAARWRVRFPANTHTHKTHAGARALI